MLTVAGGRVDRPTVGAEQPPEEGEERGQKEQRIAARQASRTQPQRLVVEIVEEKVERQHPRKGEDGYSQQQIACVRQRFETVPRRRHCDMAVSPPTAAMFMRLTVNSAPVKNVPTATPSSSGPATPLSTRKAS